MPGWLDYLVGKGEDAANAVADAAGSAVSAVTPDIIENNVTALVNNPVLGTAMNSFGPTRNMRNAVNFVQNPTAANLIGAANPGNMVMGRPAGGTNALGLAQNAAGTARYLANAAQATPGYLANTWSPTMIAALNNIKGPLDFGGIGRAGLAVADPYIQAANRPVQDYQAKQGGDAYAIAKSGGQRPADANTPFNILADWTQQHPEEWPAIIEVYENGYDYNQDGKIDFIGDRAVWEYFIGKQNTATKVGADIINDPWNATIAAGALGKGLKAGAVAGSRMEQIGSLLERGARAADTVGDLPLKPVAAALRAAHVPQLASKAASQVPWFRETEGSIRKRAADEVVDVLRPVSEAIDQSRDFPVGVPQWAVPQQGDGAYRVITVDQEPNRGAAYIVDPNGNPLPGQENSATGKGATKKLKEQAATYNESGGPEGATTSPQPTTPRYQLPRPGERAFSDPNGTTPLGTEPVTPTAPEPDLPVDGYTPNPNDPNGFTPAWVDQTQPQRRAAVDEGLDYSAPTSWRYDEAGNAVAADTRLTSVAQSMMADNPDAAGAFFREIGIDPETGNPTPGGLAEAKMQRNAEIDAANYQDFSEKVVDGKLNALTSTVREEAQAFSRAFGVEARPGLTGRTAQRPIEAVLADLDSNGLAQVVERAVLDTDDTALLALEGFARETPWLQAKMPLIRALRDEAQALPEFDPAMLRGGTSSTPTGPQRPTGRYYDPNDPNDIPGEGMEPLPEGPPERERRTVDELKAQHGMQERPQTLDEIDALIAQEEELANAMTARSRKTRGMTPEQEARANTATTLRTLARHRLGNLRRVRAEIARGEMMTGFETNAWDRAEEYRLLFDEEVALAREAQQRAAADDAFVEYTNTRAAQEDFDRAGTATETTDAPVDGTTPFPDEPGPAPSGPTSPVGTTAFRSDPSTMEFVDTLRNDGLIGADEADVLTRQMPGMERPLIDEFIDRMRNGMTAEEAIGDLQRVISSMPEVERGKVKKILHSIGGGAGKAHTFARQSMQHNILNGLPGGFGDILGNTMHLWQTGQHEAARRMLSPRSLWIAFNPIGSARASGKAGSRGVMHEFTRETNSMLAGFDREVPESILSLSALNDARFGDDDLILSKATKGRGRGTRTAASVVQSQWAQDWRKGLDANSRGVLFTQVLDDLLDPAVDRFRARLGAGADATIDAIRRHATDARAPEVWNARGGRQRTMRSFSSEDVYAITGSDKLAQAWRKELNGLYKEAADTTRKTFFAGAKRYGIDDALGKVFFFHFWQSRAIGLQLQSMIRSPRVLGGYYRMIQGAMNEADRNGYPSTFRGLTHYWGDTSAGFYGLFNPVGFLVPAMMFSDLGAQQGESWINKFANILPVGPMVNGAMAALGVSDQTPNLTGTQRIQNYVTDVVNWGNANGLDFALGGVIEDPVQAWTRHIFEKINAGVRALDVPGAQRWAPYNPINGRIDTIQSVVYHEAEQDFGPAENWSMTQWQEVQDAMTAVETGGRGNERAENAIRDFNDANMRNRLFALAIPQGSVLRYGPREQARNDKDPTPGVVTPGEQQRQIINASPEARAVLVGQEQLDTIGTERQKYFWETNNLIVYGIDNLPAERDNDYVSVGGQHFTVAQLRTMSEDERRLVANAFVSENGGTQELNDYRAQRNAFIDASPALSNFQEYKSFVGDYENGGVAGYREWAATVSPEFKVRQDTVRERYKGYGHTGAALEEELNDWAFTTDAFTAFRGERGSKYGDTPLDGASPSRDPQGMLSGGSSSGGSSGSSSGSSSMAKRIYRDLEDYQQAMAAYEGSQYQLPGMWGQANDSMYGPRPNVSAETRRYLEWAQRQPSGADTSPDAYEQWVNARAA